MFKSTLEIFRYLSEKPGESKVISNGGEIVYFGENGMLNHNCSFTYLKIWKPYVEPKKMKKVKMLAWITDEDDLQLSTDNHDYSKCGWKRVPSEDKIVEVEE